AAHRARPISPSGIRAPTFRRPALRSPEPAAPAPARPPAAAAAPPGRPVSPVGRPEAGQPERAGRAGPVERLGADLAAAWPGPVSARRAGAPAAGGSFRG